MVDDLFTIDDDGAVVLSVHAQPGAGRTAVMGRHGTALKVKVAAPPEAGRANDAVAKLLASSFGVRDGDVELVSGPSSRSKRFRISGVELDDFRPALQRLVDEGNAAPGTGVARRRR
jgi:uncharacterized protein (TIGR00251 family)